MATESGQDILGWREERGRKKAGRGREKNTET